jgi:phage gp16-like protein
VSARTVAGGGRSPDRRGQEIAKIHVGKRNLALDDDSYRALLKRIGGKPSSGDLTAQGRRLVLEHMKRLGAFDKKLDRHAASYGSAQARMVRGLWIELHQLGAIADASDQALDAFVQRQTGGAVTSARFLRDPASARPVVEALKGWVARTKTEQGKAS